MSSSFFIGRPKIDAPVRLAFSEDKTSHLLVLTRACRLLKLNAKSGKLLSVTEDMHRYGRSFLIMLL